MKKFFAFVLFFMPVFIVSGQVIYTDSREDFLASMLRSKIFRENIAAKNITSERTIGYNRNDTTGHLIYEARYDTRGNNTDWVAYKHGKVKMHNTASHDDSSRLTGYASYNGKGKLKSMSTNTYDKAGNLIEQDVYWKNTKTTATKIFKTYDNRNNVTETKSLDSKGKLKNHIVYTYYDDGSKKQTIQYSGTGKVKRVWNFDCNPVGISEAKKFKDTSKVCIHFETDKDGNPIKIKEEYTGAGFLGRTLRNITKYDKDNNMIDASSYNLKGKQLTHWSASYNQSGRIAEYIMYKAGSQKTWFRTTYSYNNDGNMAESVVYKKAQVPFSTMKYVYTSSLASPKK
jgi:hypothetical protein